MISPDKPDNFEYIIYDLETTGLNVKKDYIVEIAALYVATGDKFHCYVMPPGDEKIGGTDFHGLTRDLLIKNKAKFTKLALIDFLDWVYKTVSTKKPLCFVAHNNFGYDQLILENEFSRNKIDMNNCFYADSCPFFKNMNKFANVKLGTIYENLFGKKFENSHTAEADVYALHACLQFFPDWKDYISIRSSTYLIDDSDLKWLEWTIEKKHILDLKIYGYTNIMGMVDSVKKHGDSYLRLLNDIFGNWIGKRIYGQLHHVIKHQMKK